MQAGDNSGEMAGISVQLKLQQTEKILTMVMTAAECSF